MAVCAVSRLNNIHVLKIPPLILKPKLLLWAAHLNRSYLADIFIWRPYDFTTSKSKIMIKNAVLPKLDFNPIFGILHHDTTSTQVFSPKSSATFLFLFLLHLVLLFWNPWWRQQSFYNLISEATYHRLCYVLDIRSESWNLDHTQRKRIPSLGAILEAACPTDRAGLARAALTLLQCSEPCQELLSLHRHMAYWKQLSMFPLDSRAWPSA